MIKSYKFRPRICLICILPNRKNCNSCGVRGTGSAGPQQMLIFWVLLIFRIINVGLKFLDTRKIFTYHTAITDDIACRPLSYGVWNACET